MMILMWLLSMRGELMSQTRPSSLVLQLSCLSWQTAQCHFVLIFVNLCIVVLVYHPWGYLIKSCCDALMWCDVMLWCNVVSVLSLHIMSYMSCLVISCYNTCFFHFKTALATLLWDIASCCYPYFTFPVVG